MKTYRSCYRIITVGFVVAAMLAGCSAASRQSRRLQRAERNFEAGKYDEARIDYTAMLRADPQNSLAIQRLGQIWSEGGASLTALPYLMKARDLQPKDVTVRRRLLKGLVEIGAFNEAKLEATEIFRLAPSDGETLFLLAQVAWTPEQIADVEKQVQAFPAKDSAEFHLAAATIALRKKDISAAQGELERAVAIDPKSYFPHWVLGQSYIASKDLERAGKEFKIAAELAPMRSIVRLQYADFLFGTGKLEQAKVLLAQMTKAAPDYLPAYRLVGKIAISEKNYSEASAALQNVFAREPQDLEARMMQAEALVAEGKAKEATKVLENLSATYQGKIPAIKLQLVKAALANRDQALAEKVLDQVLANNPDLTEAILARAELNIRSDRAAQAVGPLEDLLKKQPRLEQAQVLLSSAYRALGRFDDAAKISGEQIAAASGAAGPYFTLGLTRLQQNKLDEARQAFEKAAQLEPDNILPVEQLVELDIKNKDFDSAIRRIEQQLKASPNSAGAYFVKGKIYAAKTEWGQASAAFKKAVELDGNFEQARQLLISAYLAQNEVALAMTELQAMLAKNPDDTRSRLLLALVLEKEKSFPAARDEYEKLLSVNPNFVTALNNLACLYADQLNDLNKALDLAQKARGLQPNDGAIADTLGWVLYKRGDYQQALQRLQESASKLPENPAIQYHLGMTFYMMGQPEDARSALERATGAKADFPGKEEARQRLALLQHSSHGKPDLSVSELQALHEQHPDDPSVTIRLGEALEQSGEPAKAAEAYEQALKLNPSLAGSALKLAQLYSGPLHSPDKAISYARKARDLAPNDPKTAATVGEIAFRTGNFSLAYNLLQERARAGASDPTILHDLAMTAYALGKVAEARQTMERCLQAQGGKELHQDAERFLAMTELEKPSPAAVAAESQVASILKDHPDYVPALMVKAAIRLQRDQSAEAADIYSRIMLQYPDFAPAQKRLSVIYAENPNDLAKAYGLALKARNNLPDDPELAGILARISFKRKEFVYSVQLFEQSAAAQPLSAQDLYYLGIAQLQSRQRTKGRDALNRALKAGLSGPAAEEARRQLASDKAE